MARFGRPTTRVALTDNERETLQRWARRPSSAQVLALRSRIVLASAEGRTDQDVAAELKVHPVTVSKWRHRFAAERLEGLSDAPRPGAARTVGDDVIEAVLVDTLESAPPDATHWSTRGLAKKHGISHDTVAEIWKAFGLKPWRQDSFKVSPDPDLVEKVRDLVGLYMNPPVAAAVFAVDEKPQIQALDRTAPTLPMLPTTPARATHDYVRNGTCDLFAALDMATGTVITDIRAQAHQRGFRSLFRPYRPQRAQGPRRPHHFGQPFGPQGAQGEELAPAPPPLPLALHADLRLVDEHGRAVVLCSYDQKAPAFSSPQRERARR